MTERGLPKILEELAEVMGNSQGALSLAHHFGGEDLYVPGRATPKHKLARICGLDVARALSKIRGNERVTIPLATTARLKRNRILKSDGSHAQVARATGCTIRYVKMVRAEAKKPVSMPLFDGLSDDQNKDD